MTFIRCALLIGSFLASSAAAANPFYAMDTSFHRKGLSDQEQLDLVKELGFDGVAWTEQAPEKVAASLADIERRGLKMYTIYCGATVKDNALSVSPQLSQIISALKGHGTIIWLHINGAGPSFDQLKASDPIVHRLNELAEEASQAGLRVAIYPHVGNWTARFGDAVRLARVVNHKSFGVCFNLCHCLAMGDGDRINELLDSAGPLLFTGTINGADAGVTGPKWQSLIQPLGQGSYDVMPILRKLTAIGFSGPIGFQGYGIKSDAKSILEPTIKAWRKFTKAG